LAYIFSVIFLARLSYALVMWFDATEKLVPIGLALLTGSSWVWISRKARRADAERKAKLRDVIQRNTGKNLSAGDSLLLKLRFRLR
jgi:hypothetical protein